MFPDKKRFAEQIFHSFFSAVAWSGGAFNQYTSKLMAVAIKKGFLTQHIEFLKQEYRVCIVSTF